MFEFVHIGIPSIHVMQLLNTRFPCRCRQKKGFADPWEPATFQRRQELATHTPANEAADGATWRRPYKEREVRKRQSKDNQSQWCSYLGIMCSSHVSRRVMQHRTVTHEIELCKKYQYRTINSRYRI